MENQIGIPNNQEKISEPNDRNKKIIKWAAIGVAAFFLLIILVIVGILVGIIVTSNNMKKQKFNVNAPTGQKAAPTVPASNNIQLKKGLFYDMAAKQIISAVTCAEESVLNPDNPSAGKAVCKDAAVTNDVYATIDPGICDGNTYAITVSDPTTGDGMFEYRFSCSVNGEAYTVPCDENGCVR